MKLIRSIFLIKIICLTLASADIKAVSNFDYAPAKDAAWMQDMADAAVVKLQAMTSEHTFSRDIKALNIRPSVVFYKITYLQDQLMKFEAEAEKLHQSKSKHFKVTEEMLRDPNIEKEYFLQDEDFKQLAQKYVELIKLKWDKESKLFGIATRFINGLRPSIQSQKYYFKILRGTFLQVLKTAMIRDNRMDADTNVTPGIQREGLRNNVYIKPYLRRLEQGRSKKMRKSDLSLKSEDPRHPRNNSKEHISKPEILKDDDKQIEIKLDEKEMKALRSMGLESLKLVVLDVPKNKSMENNELRELRKNNEERNNTAGAVGDSKRSMYSQNSGNPVNTNFAQIAAKYRIPRFSDVHQKIRYFWKDIGDAIVEDIPDVIENTPTYGVDYADYE